MASSVAIKELTGSQILLESLKQEGVDTIFGYPGGIIVGIYDAIYKDKDIKHYLVRHEQAAIHAAEGYARVTDKCGVALVTSGPGATNTVTGLANAYLDGYPLVVFGGQVLSNMIGTDAFQEADMLGITRSCTKHNFLVKDVKDLARVVKEAFYIANTGKKGPVYVDLAKNILGSKTNFEYPTKIDIDGYSDESEIDIAQIKSVIEAMSQAERPAIISGGGVLLSDASCELTEFANLVNSPVTTSLMGVGTYLADDDKALGMVGMHGTFAANYAVCNCDVLLAVGARFNDRSASSLADFAKNAKVIHIDVDACNVSKIIKADIPIICDAKKALMSLISELKANGIKFKNHDDWFNQLQAQKTKNNLKMPIVQSQKLHASDVLDKIAEYTKKYNPIVATEVGQHQMWAVHSFDFKQPRKLLTSGGLGTMGFGFPAAIGACVASPESLVLNIAGDGSIQMNIQELATCVEYNFPVKVLIMNNGYLGMVRQWQEKLFDQHYSETKISNPDFVKLAEAYGAKGIRVEKESQINSALEEAIAYDGPVFVDFVLESLDTVYPWVLGGKQTPQL